MQPFSNELPGDYYATRRNVVLGRVLKNLPQCTSSSEHVWAAIE